MGMEAPSDGLLATGNTATKAQSIGIRFGTFRLKKPAPSSSMAQGHADFFCTQDGWVWESNFEHCLQNITFHHQGRFLAWEQFKRQTEERISLAWIFFSIIQCNARNPLCEPLCQTLMWGKCRHTIPRVTRHRRYKTNQLSRRTRGRNPSAGPLFPRAVENGEMDTQTIGMFS